ncbi:MAG: pectate lyase, partial [Clostridia bacterium]|nr:pectate lyase [Clostridia bacterium]
DKDKDKEKEEEGNEPVISGPVAGGVKELKASENELEAAYVTWKAADNAKWYNVYYSVAGKNSWTQLDAPLVREYKDYFRADIPGLKAGEYDMKVVPVSGEDKEATDYAVTASGITVEAHTREGYAFTDNSVPGAYNMDGTLKAGAQVVYVTAANAATVKANVNGVEVAGFQSIIDARQKKDLEQTPLCFRIVGTVTKANLDHVSSSEEGLQIKGASAASPAENITIEGIGSDGTIKDFGILTRNTRNIEIRNLGILNCMDDGISIDTDNTHLWIHNNDIFYGAGGSGDKAKGDGALDTKQSSLITHSYNHFWDCGKCNLQGMKSEETTNRITYHHNWYDHSDSRHPRIRTGTVHIYNNYYDGNAKYGVGVTTGASAFVENNYFRSTAAMRPMMSSEQGTDATGDGTFSGETGGMIKSYGNYYDCTKANLKLLTQNDTTPDNIDCYEASSRDEQVPATYKTKSGGTVYSNFDTASDMYEYNVDTAEQAKTKVERYAGRIGGGDLKWEFDNEKEDANYAIIPGLKSAVTNYKTSVLKIDGVAVSGSTGGTTEGGNGEGGDEGTTNPPATVTGEIKFVPSASGSGFEVSGNLDSKSTARTVDGVSISAKSALKLESATSVTFSIDKEMTITLYLTVGTIKIDDKAQTSTSEVDGLKVITLKLAAGKHTVSKKDSGSLYLIKLTPVA